MIAIATLALPASAIAQEAAPPGNAGVEQYRESAPADGGVGRKLTKKERSALERRGDDGAALADALDRTGGVPEASPATDGGAGATNAAGGTEPGRRDTGGDPPGRPSVNGRPAESKRSGDAAPDGNTEQAPATVPDASAVTSSASATVGSIPVWALLAGGLLIVVGGMVLRNGRAA